MTLAEKKALVAEFLRRCNGYADGKLGEYRRRLEAASGPAALDLQDKITHWTAYRTFNEHTLDELERRTLDDWFGESGPE